VTAAAGAPATFEVALPIGYADAGGRLHRRARLRKLRGTDEALFYDEGLSGAELITQLILSCLVELDGVPEIDAALVSGLYSADRNYLLFELRRLTFGDRLRTSYPCPACSREVHNEEDLRSTEVRRLGDGETLPDIVVELEDGYLDRRGTAHRTLTLTLPRGIDEAFVAGMLDRDPLKARDALLLRCVKSFGALSRATLESYGVKILRDLTLGDRRRLQVAFSSLSPGVNFLRSVSCPTCGAAFDAVMDVSDFFVLS
jgi:endogenous inhibitor of DNA gyrase (YacG/DUF329 family)